MCTPKRARERQRDSAAWQGSACARQRTELRPAEVLMGSLDAAAGPSEACARIARLTSGLALLDFLDQGVVGQPQALADRRPRAPAELRFGPADVEAAVLQLARTKIGELGLDLASGGCTEPSPDGRDVGLDAGRDVVDAGRARSPRATPRRRRRRRCSRGSGDRARREWAPAVLEVAAEDRHHAGLAVGTLPGAVDVAQPADGVADARRQRPRPHVGLRRPLRRAVGRQRRGDLILRSVGIGASSP